jgi:spore germination cell wall hydrolase CwlJ-like protein
MRLRLLWYRLDKAVAAFAVFFGLIVGLLVLGALAVFSERDAAAASLREFHAKSLDCLARNIYYEARGESIAGQYAVAEVTMNRKSSPHYPKTVCDVVYQKDAFSWTGQRGLEAPAGAEWHRARKVAHEVYYQKRAPTLQGVTHYHATYVRPVWSKERERVARIGRHVFYR